MNDKQRDISLSYNGKTDNSDYSVRAFYTKLDKHRFLPYTVMIDPNAFVNGEDNEYSIWGVEGHDSIQLNDNHLLTVGAEYNKFKVEGDNFVGNSMAGHTTNMTGANTTTYAAYLQDEWMINDKFLLIPSIRYDHNSRFGSKTSPKIGATYFMNDHARFKANWGKGYKAPTVSELYMDMYHMMTYTIGNPNLRPETTDNWDVSFEGELGKSFGKITYFNNKIDNMISTHSVPFAWGIWSKTANQYYNIDGTTKTHGVELTLGHHFNDEWTVKATSNWTSATNSTAGRGDVNHGVDGVADNITTVELSYDDKNPNGWGATLWNQWFTNYNAEVSEGRNTVVKPFSYSTLNFSVNKKFANGARIYAGLDNILDKKEYDINVYGRMWRVGAEVKF